MQLGVNDVKWEELFKSDPQEFLEQLRSIPDLIKRKQPEFTMGDEQKKQLELIVVAERKFVFRIDRNQICEEESNAN